MSDSDSMVVVRLCADAFEAELAKGLLEAEGIAATVWGNDLVSAYPHSGGVRLLVSEADAESALRLLDRGPFGSDES